MLTILGGGPAGLAAAEEAARRGHAFRLFEATARTGGNCVTYQWGKFRYDSGAHRLHDQDPGVTSKLLQLMGAELSRVTAPSQIYTSHGFVTFPLSLARLPGQIGLSRLSAVTRDYLLRPRTRGRPKHFEELAVRMYGRRLAELFLLSYSEKLWGVPCSRLSPQVAGKRLGGLRLSALLPHIWSTPTHMEGGFYYPRDGYGRICDRLADSAGHEHIRTGAAVTGLLHDGRRVMEVEINGEERLSVDSVCSTLPLDVVVRALRPQPSAEILHAAGTLRNRSLLLVALFLNTPKVSDNASVYFPDPAVPFTRLVEPRNRSRRMAPDGKTSLVAEIPCFRDDCTWRTGDPDLADQVSAHLTRMGFLRSSELQGYEVRRLSHAYPVLEVGVEAQVERILGALDRFENLIVTGRNGRFVYRHLHDMVRFGIEAIDLLESEGRLGSPG